MLHTGLKGNIAYTHVKWFTDEKQTIPFPVSEVLTPSFWLWLGVTLGGLLLSAVFNETMQRNGLIRRVHGVLDCWKPYVTTILRIGLGAGLLLQLMNASFLAPEFKADAWWIKLLVTLALAGLLHPRMLMMSGAALAVLYGHALLEYGLFHGLDYMFYIGIVYYLFVAETKWKPTATPVLYLFTGLSFAWVGLEKMTMPEMSYDIIHDFNIPTFGFSVENFVLISAFIEMGLAWSFIAGILNRFISIIVTLLFITTTMVFGFKEIVGHTIVHTLLIMFVIVGDGVFKTPFEFYRSPFWRYVFVLVNFCGLLFGLMVLYVWMGLDP